MNFPPSVARSDYVHIFVKNSLIACVLGINSAHVMGLAFLAGDKHVVSVGGRDCAVIQWRVKEDRPAHAPRTQRLAAR